MTVLIRRAVASDQDAIRSLASGERVNPTGLSWSNFVVATNDAGAIGAVQLRLHRDGSKELATLVVMADRVALDQPDGGGQCFPLHIYENSIAEARDAMQAAHCRANSP